MKNKADIMKVFVDLLININKEKTIVLTDLQFALNIYGASSTAATVACKQLDIIEEKQNLIRDIVGKIQLLE